MDDFKYQTDYIDAYCQRYHGHTNWRYVESSDASVDITIIIYKEADEDKMLDAIYKEADNENV
tara:strand:- start:9756 stop:9944 length:189 start_codon:yes stop_codon:yes gene_type:complete